MVSKINKSVFENLVKITLIFCYLQRQTRIISKNVVINNYALVSI